jgi:hypothetical protein
MKLLVVLCLVGAALGGYLGVVPAFQFATATGVEELGCEVICCIGNMVLSVGGAFLGMLLAKSFSNENRLRAVDVVLPLVLGVICGGVCYAYLDRRREEPPDEPLPPVDLGAEKVAATAIKELRGDLERDVHKPGKPLIKVHLSDTTATDETMKDVAVFKHLQAL